jgi:hypothetical protein
MAALIAPAALLFAAGGSASGPASSVEEMVDAKPMAAAELPVCCLEVVPAVPVGFSGNLSVGQASLGATPNRLVSASRWRVDDRPRLLPVGVAPERGLQIKTILAARAVSAAFPEIHSIGGVRADALRWHPNGLALDVMIPNPSSAEGIALGNQIVAFAFKNAERFGLQDAIWRGVYYTPSGPQSSGYGHYDHVHLTTTGGGYPTGGEAYLR